MSTGVKETVIQSGEGGFLRGFIDYFLHKLQEKGLYNGKIVVVQPIEEGMCQVPSDQNYEYNLSPRGIDNGQVVGKHTHVTSMSRVLNPYTQYEEYIVLAENPGLRVLVSNTIEAGIECLGTENLTDIPPKSYPVKLIQFLYERHKAGLGGLILPLCELVDDNGDNPKKYVLQYAKLWELEDGFTTWPEDEDDLCSTLMDHIVTSYPRDEVEELTKQIDYEDKLIDTAEIFHLWTIDGHHEGELPSQKADYNIVWADDVHPYKKRKVRILNGGYTSMVLGAYLYRLGTVGECMKDEKISAFSRKCIFEEIIPITGDIEDNRKFGVAVLERFSNLLIEHQLLSIALNSMNKFRVRALPTILECREKSGNHPEILTFFMATLISFYRMDRANDGDEVMQFMRTVSVEEIMKREDYRHADLYKMIPMVRKYYELTQSKGVAEAYGVILGM